MKDKRQNRLVLAALAVLTLGAMALSLCVGSQGVALPRLLAALRAGDPADPVRRIVLYVRLPRMAAAQPLISSMVSALVLLVDSTAKNAAFWVWVVSPFMISLMTA